MLRGVAALFGVGGLTIRLLSSVSIQASPFWLFHRLLSVFHQSWSQGLDSFLCAARYHTLIFLWGTISAAGVLYRF